MSADKNEVLIISINMRDSSIISKGKGNANWNYSAPHGAGRLFSCSQVKRELSLEQYENAMKGICTSSVSQSTHDESPIAYKPIENILNNINDTLK